MLRPQKTLASPAAPGYELRSAQEVKQRGMIMDDFMLFEGPVFQDGPTVYLNGTAKDIYEQVIALNPDYESIFAPNADKNVTLPDPLAQTKPHTGEGSGNQGQVSCFTPTVHTSYYLTWPQDRLRY